MMEKIVEVNENVRSWRTCTICGDSTAAAKEVTFATGQDSTYGLAFCDQHFEQFKNDLNRA